MNLNLNEITCFLPFTKDMSDATGKTETQAINPTNDESLLTIKNFSPHYIKPSGNVLYLYNMTSPLTRSLKLVGSDQWNYNQDFTIQFWFYPLTTSFNALYSFYKIFYFGIIHRDEGITLHLGNGSMWNHNYRNIGNIKVYTNQWYHFAMCKKNNTIFCFINGIKALETLVTDIDFNYNISSENKTAYIGKWEYGDIGSENYFGEFMIDMGRAWYTDGFTPKSFVKNASTIYNNIKLDE